MPQHNHLKFEEKEEDFELKVSGFEDQEYLPSGEKSLAPKSTDIIHRDTYKNLFQLLLPVETGATGEASPVVLNNAPAVQFADGATNDAYFILLIPPDYTIYSMMIIWSTPAVSGNLNWTLSIHEGGAGDNTNIRTTGGTYITTATTSDVVYNFTEALGTSIGINFSTIRKEGVWTMKLSRNSSDAADTLTNTMNLYGILLKYR